MARLRADEAFFTSARLNTAKMVKAAVDKASLTVPKSLDGGGLAEKVETARAAATKAFTDAETHLDGAINRQSGDMLKSLSQSAGVVKMVEQYDHWAFARSIGDAQAGTFLTAAKDAALDLDRQGVALPLPLPPEIALPVTAPPSGATSAPADTGTTPPPATPATTADSPEQADVRKAYVAFNEVILSGDADKAKSMIVADPQFSNEVDIVVKLMASMTKIANSAATKFGDPGKQMAGGIMNGFRQAMSADRKIITVNGDVATIADSADDKDPDTMKKVDGAWKPSRRRRHARTCRSYAGVSETWHVAGTGFG